MLLAFDALELISICVTMTGQKFEAFKARPVKLIWIGISPVKLIWIAIIPVKLIWIFIINFL